jgi:transposase
LVVKLPGPKRGFALLPRRRGGERGFARAGRFRRRARDFDRSPATRAGLHALAFVLVFLRRFAFQSV